MKTLLRSFLLVLSFVATAASAAETRPIVVELFTSQGCSSCPPADALLGELAKRKDIIALGFHITYWDNAQWRDPLSRQESTDRQRAYDQMLTRGQAYTPQIVVEGTEDVIGSDRGAVLTAIDRARPVAVAAADFSADRHAVTIGPGTAPNDAIVLLARYRLKQSVQVKGGENAGHAATDFNGVTGLKTLGRWDGRAATYSIEPPTEDEGLAVLVQAPDGKILGAAAAAPAATSLPPAPRA